MLGREDPINLQYLYYIVDLIAKGAGLKLVPDEMALDGSFWSDMPVVCRLSHNYHVVARHSPQFSRLPQGMLARLLFSGTQIVFLRRNH